MSDAAAVRADPNLEEEAKVPAARTFACTYNGRSIRRRCRHPAATRRPCTSVAHEWLRPRAVEGQIRRTALAKGAPRKEAAWAPLEGREAVRATCAPSAARLAPPPRAAGVTVRACSCCAGVSIQRIGLVNCLQTSPPPLTVPEPRALRTGARAGATPKSHRCRRPSTSACVRSDAARDAGHPALCLTEKCVARVRA